MEKKIITSGELAQRLADFLEYCNLAQLECLANIAFEEQVKSLNDGSGNFEVIV